MSEQVENNAVDKLVESGAVPNKEYVAQNQGVTLGDVNPQKEEGPKRPDHIPEKFWDAEKGTVRIDELAKSYSELEKNFSKPKDPADKPADTPKANEEKPKDDNSLKIEPAKESNPITVAIEQVASEYASKGEVTPEAIESLEKLGLPRNIVDTYLQGVKALEAQTASEAAQIVGGKERFDAIKDWAAKNLTDAELEYYNKNVDDPTGRKVALEWLNSKYSATQPKEGRLINQDGSQKEVVSGDVFTNAADVTAAMRSARYKQDPAFRQEVAEKLARSRRAGTYSGPAEFYRE